MGKRTLCAALCLALFLSSNGTTTAADLPQEAGASVAAAQTEMVELAAAKQVEEPQGIQIEVNGTSLGSVITDHKYDTVYANYLPVLHALYPNATAVWQNGGVDIQDEGLSVRLQPGLPYLVANGRYLYLDSKSVYIGREGAIMVPLRQFCSLLGADVALNGNVISVTSTGAGPIQSGDSYYDADTLYWLSHIIYAESGNQSLRGKIAVGNVVLNRVADPRFPSTVKSVVFQRNQFTPVSNGTIYLEPSAESIAAAKLCLDGANTAGNSLYFVNPRVSPNCWAIRNRPHVATIGAHAFFA